MKNYLIGLLLLAQTILIAQDSITFITASAAPKDFVFLITHSDTIPIYIITPVSEFSGYLIQDQYRCLQDVSNKVVGKDLHSPPRFFDLLGKSIPADRIKMYWVEK
jgi:hypothetical protein